jgi:hypothetical protein
VPWPSFRHRPDDELWDIIAYWRHGIKPVTNKVADSEGSTDIWAGNYVPGRIGPFPLPPYPATNEEFMP